MSDKELKELIEQWRGHGCAFCNYDTTELTDALESQAAEISTLKADVKFWRRNCEEHVKVRAQQTEDLKSQAAEIERLTADRDEWERLWKKASNAVLSLQARVEVLECVRDAASDFLVNHMDDDYAMLLDEALAATEQEGE